MVLIILIFLLCLIIWRGISYKFYNPYRLVILFGPKGCGKSTYLTKKGLFYLSRGYKVYANFPLPGACPVDAAVLAGQTLSPGSVLLIDEAALDWDNRAFKSFPGGTLEWFRLQRHEKCIVYLASQSYDLDKKLRDLADELWIFERKFTLFSYGRRVIKKICVTEPTQGMESKITETYKILSTLYVSVIFDSIPCVGSVTQGMESKITETYKVDSILFFLFGSRTFTFLPRYVGLFDSFSPTKRKIYLSREYPGEIFVPKPLSVAYQLWADLVQYYFPVIEKVYSQIQRAYKTVRPADDLPTADDIRASKRYKLDTFMHGPKPPPDV